MGYYSDVYIKATHDVAPEIFKLITATDLRDSALFSEDDFYFYVEFKNIKWYDSYPEIAAINHCIERLGSEEKATMIRKGESSDDLETYGTYPHDLDLYPFVILELDGFNGNSGLSRLQQSNPELFI